MHKDYDPRTVSRLAEGRPGSDLQAVLDATLSGLCVVSDRQVVLQNAAWSALLGPDQAPQVLEQCALAHPDDPARLERFFARLARRDFDEAEIEIQLALPPGADEGARLRWLRLRAGPIECAGREAVLFSALDVSEARKLMRIEEIHDRMASLGRLTTGLAHEIRNSLSGVNLYLSALQQQLEAEVDVDKAMRIVAEIRNASSRIELIMDRIRDFSRPGEPRLEPSNLNQCIRDTVELCSTSLRKKGIGLELELRPDLPFGRFDPHQIGRVLVNLINNAADAAAAFGQRPARVMLVSRIETDALVVSVLDSGEGVPRALRAAIFEPFFSTKPEGNGLGLSISRRILRDHDGRLEVQDGLLGGAEFRLVLPVVPGGVSP
jgi:signal transduction histidine kinase